MRRLQAMGTALNEEVGHATPLVGVLPAAAGAVLLAIGAANDTGWLAVTGGIVLAVALVVTALANHMGVEYDIYDRLNKLEKSE